MTDEQGRALARGLVFLLNHIEDRDVGMVEGTLSDYARAIEDAFGRGNFSGERDHLKEMTTGPWKY